MKVKIIFENGIERQTEFDDEDMAALEEETRESREQMEWVMRNPPADYNIADKLIEVIEIYVYRLKNAKKKT